MNPDTTYTADHIELEALRKSHILSNRWIRHLALITAIALPLFVMFFAPVYRWGIAFFAYLNCLLYAVFAVYFIKKGTLSSLIPIIAPIRLIFGTSLSIIYFEGVHATTTLPPV